jgi:hypothetical protein
MKYRRIDLEGRPMHFARMERPAGSGYINIEILLAEYYKRHSVMANDRKEHWSMAKTVQERLDGFRGSDPDILPYYDAIRLLAK